MSDSCLTGTNSSVIDKGVDYEGGVSAPTPSSPPSTFLNEGLPNSGENQQGSSLPQDNQLEQMMFEAFQKETIDLYNDSTLEKNAKEIGEQYVLYQAHNSYFFYPVFSLGFLTKASKIRRFAVWLSTWPMFEGFILSCIIMNSVFLALADFDHVDSRGNLSGENSIRNLIIVTSEPIFTAIFSLEIVIRIIAQGFIRSHGSYLRSSGFNQIDFVIVLLALLSTIPGIPDSSFIRIVRSLRIIRSLSLIPSLRLVVSSLLWSLPSLGSVLLLLAVFFSMFGMFLQQMYGGTMHGRCRLTEFPVQLGNYSCSNPNSMDCYLSISNSSVSVDDPYYGVVFSEKLGMHMNKRINDSLMSPCVPGLTSMDDELLSFRTTLGSSPWSESRNCFWPTDPLDFRLCSLESSSGRRCPPDRWCGSNYDSFGHSRFSDDYITTSGTYVDGLNWGFTNFDNIFVSLATVFQIATLEGWTIILYQVQDTNDPLLAAILFTVMVILLAYFSLNLTLAVLWSAFQSSEKAARFHIDLTLRGLASIRGANQLMEDSGLGDSSSQSPADLKVQVYESGTRTALSASNSKIPHDSRLESVAEHPDEHDQGCEEPTEPLPLQKKTFNVSSESSNEGQIAPQVVGPPSHLPSHLDDHSSSLRNDSGSSVPTTVRWTDRVAPISISLLIAPSKGAKKMVSDDDDDDEDEDEEDDEDEYDEFQSNSRKIDSVIAYEGSRISAPLIASLSDVPPRVISNRALTFSGSSKSLLRSGSGYINVHSSAGADSSPSSSRVYNNSALRTSSARPILFVSSSKQDIQDSESNPSVGISSSEPNNAQDNENRGGSVSTSSSFVPSERPLSSDGIEPKSEIEGVLPSTSKTALAGRASVLQRGSSFLSVSKRKILDTAMPFLSRGSSVSQIGSLIKSGSRNVSPFTPEGSVPQPTLVRGASLRNNSSFLDAASSLSSVNSQQAAPANSNYDTSGREVNILDRFALGGGRENFMTTHQAREARRKLDKELQREILRAGRHGVDVTKQLEARNLMNNEDNFDAFRAVDQIGELERDLQLQQQHLTNVQGLTSRAGSMKGFTVVKPHAAPQQLLVVSDSKTHLEREGERDHEDNVEFDRLTRVVAKAEKNAELESTEKDPIEVLAERRVELVEQDDLRGAGAADTAARSRVIVDHHRYRARYTLRAERIESLMTSRFCWFNPFLWFLLIWEFFEPAEWTPDDARRFAASLPVSMLSNLTVDQVAPPELIQYILHFFDGSSYVFQKPWNRTKHIVKRVVKELFFSESISEEAMNEEKVTKNLANHSTFVLLCDSIASHPLWQFMVFSLIVINMIAFCLDDYTISPTTMNIVEAINLGVTVIFTVDLLVTIGSGSRPIITFDFIVVMVSLIELLMSPPRFDDSIINAPYGSRAYLISSGSTFANMLRSFRVLRVIKLLRSLTTMNIMLNTMIRSLRDAANFGLLLSIFIFLFSLIGMQVFGGRFCFDDNTGLPAYVFGESCSGTVPDSHFNSFDGALITVFSIFTTEGWPLVFYDAWRAAGWQSVFFFIALIIIGQFIILDLFEAVLLANFENISEHVTNLRNMQENLLTLIAKRVRMSRRRLKALRSIILEIPENEIQDVLKETTQKKDVTIKVLLRRAKVLQRRNKMKSGVNSQIKSLLPWYWSKSNKVAPIVSAAASLSAKKGSLSSNNRSPSLRHNSFGNSVSIDLGSCEMSAAPVNSSKGESVLSPKNSERLPSDFENKKSSVVSFAPRKDETEVKDDDVLGSNCLSQDRMRQFESFRPRGEPSNWLSKKQSELRHPEPTRPAAERIDFNPLALVRDETSITEPVPGDSTTLAPSSLVASAPSAPVVRTDPPDGGKPLPQSPGHFNFIGDGALSTAPIFSEAAHVPHAPIRQDTFAFHNAQYEDEHQEDERSMTSFMHSLFTTQSSLGSMYRAYEEMLHQHDSIPIEDQLICRDNLGSIYDYGLHPVAKMMEKKLEEERVLSTSSSSLFRGKFLLGISDRLRSFLFSASKKGLNISDNELDAEDVGGTFVESEYGSGDNSPKPKKGSPEGAPYPADGSKKVAQLKDSEGKAERDDSTPLCDPSPRDDGEGVSPLSPTSELSSASPTSPSFSDPQGPSKSILRGKRGNMESSEDSKKLRTTSRTEFKASNTGKSLWLFRRDHPIRRFCLRLSSRRWFDYLVFSVVILSSVLLALDEPLKYDAIPHGFELEVFIVSFFTLEAICKIVATGFVFNGYKSYLRNPWNMLDFFIVVTSIIALLLGSSVPKLVRSFRVLRALRPLRITRAIPGLRLIIAAVALSLSSILNVLFFIFMFVFILTLVAVGGLKGQMSECTGPVFAALPSFMIDLINNPVTTDLLSFDQIEFFARKGVPYIPASLLNLTSGIPFPPSPFDPLQPADMSEMLEFVTSNGIDGNDGFYSSAPTSKTVCLLSGAEWAHTRYGFHFDDVLNGMNSFYGMQTTEGWVDMLHQMTSARGVDMTPAPQSSPFWSVFAIFSMIFGAFFIFKIFIGVVLDNFNVMKARLGGSSFLSVDQREWIKTQKLLSRLHPESKEYLGILDSNPEIKPYQHRAIRILRHPLYTLYNNFHIFLSVFSICANYFGSGPKYMYAMKVLSLYCSTQYVADVFFRLFVLRHHYFDVHADRFHFTDLVSSLLSISGQVIYLFHVNLGNFLIAFRMFRSVRFLGRIRSLSKLYSTFTLMLPSLINTGGLLLLVMFVYAVVGMNLFSTVQWPPSDGKPADSLGQEANFQTFHTSFLTLLRAFTGEGWNYIMNDLVIDRPGCIDELELLPLSEVSHYCGFSGNPSDRSCEPIKGCGSFGAIPFFITYMILVYQIGINLLVAVVLEGYAELDESEDNHISDQQLHELTEIWATFDPHGTNWMHADWVPAFLQKVPPPLGYPNAHLASLSQLQRRAISLHIPIFQYKYVHFNDVCLALIKRVFVDFNRKVSKTFSIPVNEDTKYIQSKLFANRNLPYSFVELQEYYAVNRIKRKWKFVRARKLRAAKKQGMSNPPLKLELSTKQENPIPLPNEETAANP